MCSLSSDLLSSHTGGCVCALIYSMLYYLLCLVITEVIVMRYFNFFYSNKEDLEIASVRKKRIRIRAVKKANIHVQKAAEATTHPLNLMPTSNHISYPPPTSNHMPYTPPTSNHTYYTPPASNHTPTALTSDYNRKTMSNSTVCNIVFKAKCSIEAKSDYSYPSDHRFDAMMEKDHRFDAMMEKAAEERDAKLQKQATVMKKYSYFANNAESFPLDQRTLEIPRNRDRFDRVSVMAQMQDMLARENTALQSARIYRNRFTDLKKRIRELEEEREGFRYFWRNKVLEGNSRGKMVMMAINSRK